MPDEVLTLDKLCSGDRPSIYSAGALLAQALGKSRVAVLQVDVLGRVILRSPSVVGTLAPPLVPPEDLDAMTEDDAISVMVQEARSEEAMLAYLKGRSARGVGDGHAE